MKKIYRALTILTFINLIFLTSCALSSGKKISDEQVSQIQKNVTTKADINRMFGNSTSTTVDANGNEVWTFGYAEEKYIPGSKGRGRYDQHGQTLIIMFTDNKVSNYRFSKH